MPANALRGFFPKLLVFVLLALVSRTSLASEIDPFVGSYSGTAEVENGGDVVRRNMSVDIARTEEGFDLSWVTITHKPNGKTKEKQYNIEFVKASRPGVFSSGMKLDLFGNRVPLNPISGDPYVWGHISGKTITIYALNIIEDGGYEMQEYRRTLSAGGLDLEYIRIRNGEKLKSIRSFLKKTE